MRAAVALASLVLGCADSDATWWTDEACEPAAAPGDGMVRVTAQGAFELDGKPYLPRGVNSYPLLQHVGNGDEAAAEDILAQAAALGRPLVRTPAFLDAGDNPARLRDDRGVLREAGLVALDRVLALAAEHDVRLILILTNNWPDFGGAEAVLEMVAPGEHLPKNAFWSEPRALSAQLDYERALAARINSVNGRSYAEDPTIFAWELANEARCEHELTPSPCNAQTLVRWAGAMAEGLRTAGVKQPIAWGGAGHLGEHGEHLAELAAAHVVDILTMHLYEQSAVDLPPILRFELAMARGSEAIRTRAALAREHALPLLLEEVNWKPAAGTADSDAERATVLATWLEQARALRVGALPWMIGEPGRADYDGYLIDARQPTTLAVLRCE